MANTIEDIIQTPIDPEDVLNRVDTLSISFMLEDSDDEALDDWDEIDHIANMDLVIEMTNCHNSYNILDNVHIEEIEHDE